MVRTQTVLDSWKVVRQDTIHAVNEFPASSFDEHPIPDVMSFREIARHILDVGYVLTGVLLDGIDNLATPDFRQMRQKYIHPLPADAQPDALAGALEESLNTRTAELALRSPEFFAREITRFDGQRVTRLELLQFAKEHELEHRSQLFVLLRLRGIVPSTTRRRRAAQAKA